MHGQMMDSPLLITEIMRFADRNFPDGQVVSITFDNPRHRTTYREVFRRARKLANALRAAGIKPGDRIATLAWNDYRHLELYYAVSCMGAVLHTINPRLFPEQLEYIVNHAEDRLIFIDPTLLPVLAPLQGKIPTVERVIVMTSAAAMPPAVAGKLPDYESFIADQPDEFDWPALEESAAQARCATPRAPPATRRACCTAIVRRYCTHMRAAWRTRWECRAATCVLAVVPMFHANAWGLPYNAPITGAKLVFPGPKMGDAATLTELMNEDGVTLAAGVPTVWTLLLNYLRQSGVKLKTLNRTVVGGAAVPLSMIRDSTRARRHGRAGLGHDGNEPARHREHAAPRDGVAAAGGAVPAARARGPRHLRRLDEDRGRGGARTAVGRQGVGRAQGARALGLQRLLPDRVVVVARCGRLVRNGRRRGHPSERLPADHRSRQGRHQVGRRVDQLRGPRELRLRAPGRADGSRDRRASPEVGRAPDPARRADARATRLRAIPCSRTSPSTSPSGSCRTK